MIKKAVLNSLAIKYQTLLINIYREYCQHVFLSFLYRRDVGENVLFKGGTALRLVYGSPRYSEDLDFSLFKITTKYLEKNLLDTIADLDKIGLSPKILESKETSGGYLANLEFEVYGERIKISIQGSRRRLKKRLKSNIQLVAGDFIPAYPISLLAENLLIGEKLQAALIRSKPRDFFDVYLLLRKNLIPMKFRPQLKKIPQKLDEKNISFKRELGIFLPRNMNSLVSNFNQVLSAEIKKFF